LFRKFAIDVVKSEGGSDPSPGRRLNLTADRARLGQTKTWQGRNALRIVALEEHFLVPSLIDKAFPPRDVADNPGYDPERDQVLGDLENHRIADMDMHGVSQQIVSATMPGADRLDGEEGIRFARATNDRLAEAVRRHPNRIGGFAHLPMREPAAAADELERAIRDLGFCGAMVNGMTEDRFLDDPKFSPILERLCALDVPLYIHPNVPPKAVHDVYYGDLPPRLAAMLASGMHGWHGEVAIHVYRLALSGTFEKFPSLKVIIGHMGETMPFTLARADWCVTGDGRMERPISEVILKHVYITTSGVFTIPPFLNALMVFGADRIMYSVDYPYSTNVQGRAFLDSLPISPADREKIAHCNADRILKLRVNN
jgi:uncharacterized protein